MKKMCKFSSLFFLVFSIMAGCAVPKKLDPAVKEKSFKIFNAIKKSASDTNQKIIEKDTEIRDMGGYVPDLIFVHTAEGEPVFIDEYTTNHAGKGKFTFGPVEDGKVVVIHDVTNLAAGTYKAKRYKKYYMSYSGDASGKVNEMVVWEKYGTYIEELKNGVPSGRAEWGYWDKNWKKNEAESIKFLNKVRKNLGYLECDNLKHLECK